MDPTSSGTGGSSSSTPDYSTALAGLDWLLNSITQPSDASLFFNLLASTAKKIEPSATAERHALLELIGRADAGKEAYPDQWEDFTAGEDFDGLVLEYVKYLGRKGKQEGEQQAVATSQTDGARTTKQVATPAPSAVKSGRGRSHPHRPLLPPSAVPAAQTAPTPFTAPASTPSASASTVPAARTDSPMAATTTPRAPSISARRYTTREVTRKSARQYEPPPPPPSDPTATGEGIGAAGGEGTAHPGAEVEGTSHPEAEAEAEGTIAEPRPVDVKQAEGEGASHPREGTIASDRLPVKQAELGEATGTGKVKVKVKVQKGKRRATVELDEQDGPAPKKVKKGDARLKSSKKQKRALSSSVAVDELSPGQVDAVADPPFAAASTAADSASPILSMEERRAALTALAEHYSTDKKGDASSTSSKKQKQKQAASSSMAVDIPSLQQADAVDTPTFVAANAAADPPSPIFSMKERRAALQTVIDSAYAEIMRDPSREMEEMSTFKMQLSLPPEEWIDVQDLLFKTHTLWVQGLISKVRWAECWLRLCDLTPLGDDVEMPFPCDRKLRALNWRTSRSY